MTIQERNKRITIKDVAQAAGVSTQTVSRVMNNASYISEKTRQRVMAVVEEMGYRPSALARSLIRQRSHTLGVVTAGLRYIGPSRTLSGIASAAEEAGYSLLLKELPQFDEDEIIPIIQAFLSRHVDGIIWAVPEVGENRAWVNERFSNFEIPLVYLTMEPKEGISVVSIDNYQGGRMATSHLLEQGYKHIAHISGPLDWWEARQRKAAWADVLKEAGLDVRDEYWVDGNWSSASAVQAFEKLLGQYPDMDSIFVANDQMALTVMQVAWQRGLRIPEDLGLVGFDNIPESPFFSTPLTTVDQEQYNFAKLAVKEIIKTIESNWGKKEPDGPTTIILPPRLVVRQSSLRKRE